MKKKANKIKCKAFFWSNVITRMYCAKSAHYIVQKEFNEAFFQKDEFEKKNSEKFFKNCMIKLYTNPETYSTIAIYIEGFEHIMSI